MRAIALIIAFASLFTVFFVSFSFAAVNISPISLSSSTPIIGDPFILNATLSGALAGNNYYIKCRIGPNSSSLSDGQTYNSQTTQWLDDTGSSGSWTDMPQITVGSDGSWQGSFQCRLKNSATDETKLLFVRACLNSNNSCGTSFQSTNSLSLNPIFPTSTPTPIPTSTNTPTPSPTPTKTPTPTPIITPTKVLSPTVIPTTAESKSLSPTLSQNVLGSTDKPSPTDSISRMDNARSMNKLNKGSIFLLLGLFFVILCVIVVFWEYKEKIFEKIQINEENDS